MSVTPRTFAAVLGGIALLIGLLALAIPTSVDQSGGGTLSCGSGFTGVSEEVGYADTGKSIADTMYPSFADDDEKTYEAQCEDKIGARRAWGWPVFALGGIVAAGALLVRTRPAQSTR